VAAIVLYLHVIPPGYGCRVPLTPIGTEAKAIHCILRDSHHSVSYLQVPDGGRDFEIWMAAVNYSSIE
jgi:hypothetical protein